MFGRKYLVDLQVAIAARVLIKWRGITFYVTILAEECSAIRLDLMRGQFERNRVVIKCGWTPAHGAMTSSALVAKRALVRVIFGVTRGTVHGRALEDAIDMAVRTSNSGMLPIQMECEFRMVHCGRFPASGQMAGSALGTKLTLMIIIFFMT